MFTRLILPQGGACYSDVNNTCTCATLLKISRVKTVTTFLGQIGAHHHKDVYTDINNDQMLGYFRDFGQLVLNVLLVGTLSDFLSQLRSNNSCEE